MSNLSSARHFRLLPGNVDCDAAGLRIGPVHLLARGAGDRWTPREEDEIRRDLGRIHGRTLDLRSKYRRLEMIAGALNQGEVALAQISALLLQFPDPPLQGCADLGEIEKRLLARDLLASGLLKADDDWDEQHPRTGTDPNPGWFASKPKSQQPAITEEPTTADIVQVAYQGDYHDVVAAEEIEEYRGAGAICISEARLSLGPVTARIDILCRTRSGGLLGAEIKTGKNPALTPNQAFVYTHSQIGGLTSPDTKISQLGFSPDELLPPFPIVIVYAEGPGATKRFFGPVE